MRHALLGGLTAALLLSAALGATSEVAPGVELVPGGFAPGAQPDGNSILLRGSDGLVIVDSGRHAEHTRRVIDRARAAGVPVRAIVNTHWHLDHVGGNPALRREFPDARVYATDAIHGALDGFLARYRGQLESMVAAAESEASAAPLRAELALLDAGPALAPDIVVAASGRRALAGRELDLRVATHAVTAGDLWLIDLATRTLVAGDLVTLPAPFLDTACPARWSAALGELAASDFELLIPGHGPPMDRAAFARYRSGFDALVACAATDAPAAVCVDGWIAAAGEWIPEAERDFARAVTDYYVAQVLRAGSARLAPLCGEKGAMR